MSEAAGDEFDPDVGPPEIWEDWMRVPWRLKFVETLKKTGNKSLSCKEAAISRQQMYRTLELVPAFREAVLDAVDESMDLLEQVAWQRATVGTTTTDTREVVDGQGNVISVETKETRRISDTLLIFLLKGGRPEKYRENVSVLHTGKDGKQVEVKVERERSPERFAELLEIAMDLGWLPKALAPPPEMNGDAGLNGGSE